MSELAFDPAVDFSEQLEAIRESLAVFVDQAHRAGLQARVPSCPEWTVHELIAHQGMVHRWATAELRGERSNPSMYEGLEQSDPISWLHDGGVALVETLESVPEDVQALVFLDDAPPPRRFWARRQCHETTMHAVDALSATLERLPRAEETWINRETALDGIDELLTGFVTRGKSRLRSDEPVSLQVRPDDDHRRWTVHMSREPAVTERRAHHRADVVVEGGAVALFLALWNRGDEVDVTGSGDTWGLWRRTARITWG